jgi:hypothetical protein
LLPENVADVRECTGICISIPVERVGTANQLQEDMAVLETPKERMAEV